MLWHHSKVAPFRWTPERQGQYSIDFWTLETPFLKCPPPFWQAQPNPRAFYLFKSLFTSIPVPSLCTLLLWAIHTEFGLQ